MLKPMGNATIEELEEAFFGQASALIKGGADIISIETMFSLDEALSMQIVPHLDEYLSKRIARATD